MKTILDAVNTLKGVWPSDTIQIIEIDGVEFSEKEFNAQVVRCSNNVGLTSVTAKPIKGLVPGYYYEFKDNKNKHWEVGVLLNVEGGKYQSKCGNKTEWFDEIAQCTGVFGKVDNRTPEDIALDDIAGCRHVSKERESNRNILNAIKENKIHGVTWTGK